MPFITGLQTDLSDPNSIPDPTVLVRASAIQLPMNRGRFWNDMVLFRDPESNRKFDIFSRSKNQRAGTIGAAGWDASATSNLDVTSSVGLVKGLILQIQDELVIVNAITSATKITVLARGAAGTTAATHAAAVTYSVIGSAINDIHLKDVGSVSEASLIYVNYHQTVAEAIDYTRAIDLDPRTGLSESMKVLLQEEALIRVAENIMATSINGQKQLKTGDAVPWMTAGLIQQLTDNTGGRLVLTDAIGGALTEAALRASLRTVTDTGTPTDIYVSSANKDIINGFNASSASTTFVVNKDAKDTAAGVYVNKYDYEGLILNVKIDSGLPNDQIPIVNINNCHKGWKAGDELRLEKQPDQSSREHRDAYNGSFGMAIENVGYEHIMMTGLTT